MEFANRLQRLFIHFANFLFKKELVKYSKII